MAHEMCNIENWIHYRKRAPLSPTLHTVISLHFLLHILLVLSTSTLMVNTHSTSESYIASTPSIHLQCTYIGTRLEKEGATAVALLNLLGRGRR